jgi:hypothetical protein
MLFDVEYNIDRLLREQPAAGQFAGADRRAWLPSGQARLGQPSAMASIWSLAALPDAGSTSISEDECGMFLRELTDILSSNLASFSAEDQLDITSASCQLCQLIWWDMPSSPPIPSAPPAAISPRRTSTFSLLL